MSARRIAIIAAAGALAAGGAGAAIAAVSADDAKKNEDAVLADAAKRLNVTPEKLREALKSAQLAQLDKRLDGAVKNGDLTQKQADAIKQERRESGSVLRFGQGRGHKLRGGPAGPGRMHFHRGRGIGLFEDVAKALGITERQLFTRLRRGDSFAKIAKAEGKSLSSVKSSVKAAAKARADKAVKAGDLTRKQADAMLEHLDEHLDKLGRGPHLRFRGGPGKRPPRPGVRPGNFVPEPPLPGGDIVIR